MIFKTKKKRKKTHTKPFYIRKPIQKNLMQKRITGEEFEKR